MANNKVGEMLVPDGPGMQDGSRISPSRRLREFVLIDIERRSREGKRPVDLRGAVKPDELWAWIPSPHHILKPPFPILDGRPTQRIWLLDFKPQSPDCFRIGNALVIPACEYIYDALRPRVWACEPNTQRGRGIETDLPWRFLWRERPDDYPALACAFQIRKWPSDGWHLAIDERGHLSEKDWEAWASLDRRESPTWISDPVLRELWYEGYVYYRIVGGQQLAVRLDFLPGSAPIVWKSRTKKGAMVLYRQILPGKIRQTILVSAAATTKSLRSRRAKIFRKEVSNVQLWRRPPSPEEAADGVTYVETKFKNGRLQSELRRKGRRGYMAKELHYNFKVNARQRLGGTPDEPLPESKTFSHATVFSQLVPTNPDLGEGDLDDQVERYLDGYASVYDRQDIRGENELVAADAEGVDGAEPILEEARQQDQRADDLRVAMDDYATSWKDCIEIDDAAVPLDGPSGGNDPQRRSAKEARERLDSAMEKARLSFKARQAMRMFLLQGKGPNEIGKRINRSRSRVSRILQQSLRALGANPSCKALRR